MSKVIPIADEIARLDKQIAELRRALTTARHLTPLVVDDARARTTVDGLDLEDA